MSFLRSSISAIGALAALCLLALGVRPGAAQDKLTEVDFRLLGLSVAPEPEVQTVPRNTATALSVSVRFAESTADPELLLSLLPPGLEVAAEIVGPNIEAPITLRGPPGALLPIPPLTSRGLYLVRDIRLEKDGEPYLRASPDTATVEVIDRVLVTQVTTRPLTREELAQKGILFGEDSFTAFNFRLALRLDSRPVAIDLPVVFDSQNVPVPVRPTGGISATGPGLPVVNTGVTPVMMMPDVAAIDEDVLADLPADIRIPGLLVVPGEVGFLNQFFSGLLLVSNGSPAGSGLTVSGLTGEVELPVGEDAVPDSGDEPLVLAVTEGGPPQGQRVAEIRGLGLDGVSGTADDTIRFGPGEQGQAEYLFEGKLEGFHEIRFDLHGTLEGLPVGPIPISGVARGGVLVRNPDFQLTFSAPATVRAQEEFTLYITVTNVSRANAALVRLALGGGVSGAALAVGESEVREIEDLGAGESETVPYRFVATQTGQVTASYLRVEGGTGSLLFRMGVGERGVPLSPDTIVLPTTVAALASPAEIAISASPRVVQAATRVLGLAWSTATAPEGTLPEGVTRLSKGVVVDRATELAEAGFRVQLGESLERALVDLALAWVGASDAGFEELLRETEAGRGFLAAVGTTLAEIPSVPSDLAELHRSLADAFSSREAHLLIGARGSATLRVLGSAGELGSTLPHAGFVPLDGSRGLALLPRVSGSRYDVELAGSVPADLVLNVPFVGGGIGVYAFEGVALEPGLVARLALDLRTSPDHLTLSLVRNGIVESTADSAPVEFVAPRGPKLLAATVIGPETLNGADPWGRLLAVLFDREVRAAEAEQIASYAVEENQVLSALRQISGRLVFLFLRDPLGNFVPRTASATRLFDPTGKPMTPLTQSASVVSRILGPGAVVSGRVLNADGTPVPTAEVLYMNSTGANLIGLSLKPVAPDGSYGFDYVRRGDAGGSFAIRARDAATGAIQQLATRVTTDGEHLRVDLVLRGRGGVEGFVTDLGGAPRPGARVLVTSQADPTSFALTKTDGDGYYRAPGLVVGSVSVKAVDGVFSGLASGSLLRAGTFARVDVTLNAGSGRVHGNVLELAEGMVSRALGNVDVYLVTADDLVAASAKSSPSGAYLFESVPTGAFRVVAVDLVTGRQTSSLLQTLDAGGDLAVDLFFELASVGTLRGTVSTEAGPIAGAVVSAAGRQVATADTGAGPEFVIANVPVGTHVVSASLPGTNRIARATVGVAEGATTSVDLRLSGTGQVRVTVLDTAGVSVGEGQQVLRVSGSNACAGEIALTDASGVATFTGVTVPGATFKASRGGDIAVGQAILTREGETALLTLRFQGFGTVFGVVSDENGPVLGADVALGALRFDSRLCAYVPDGRARQLRTDSAGRYRFENVPVGAVTVTATAGTGTSLPATAKASLLAQGDTRELNLTLTDHLGGAVEGVVLLPDGKTPAGAGVRVTTTSNIGAEVTVTTDAAGKYAFAKILAPGRYTLTASDPVTGRVARSTVFLQLEQDLTANLRLLGRGTVEVTVRDGSGQRVDEAFVELAGASYPFDARAGAIVPSDQGVLRFERVSEGELTVSATADGRGGRATGAVSGEGTTTRVNVTLTSVGKLAGVLRSPDGASGVPNAEILVKQGATGRLLGATTTSSVPRVVPDVCKAALGSEGLGYFELDALPAGSLLVTATDPLTGRIGEASSSIEADGETACVEVRLLGLGTVTGTVRDGADAVPGASATLTSTTGLSGTANLKAEATTNGAGGFRFEGVPVGNFTVKATLPGALLTGTETGAIAKDGDTIDVDVPLEPSGAIHGTVFEADGTTVVPRALVTLRPPKGTLRVESNANGSFAFDFVPAGAFTLTAEENGGFDAGRLEGTLASGEVLEGLELRFNGTGGIEGTAHDANDQLLSTGLVRLTTPAPFARSETATVDAAGSFRFLEVPAGPFELGLEVAGSPLRGFASGDVVVDDTVTVELKLEEARPVSGRVLRDDGATPAPNVPVILKGSGFTLGDLTDAAGGFRIDGVPLGSFTLDARDVLTGGIALAAGALEESTPDTGLDVGALVLDSTPIEVVATSPADGAALVPPDAAIDVVFSDPVGSASLVGLLSVTANAGPVLGARELVDERTGRFTATPFLPPNAELTVTVSGSLKDVFGRPLGEDVQVRFTTGGAVVTGIVTNFGAPVEGAGVELGAVGTTLQTATDAGGRYRFENVPAGSASLLVTTGALAGGAVLDVGPADGVVRADVALSVVGSVAGRVFEWNGAAASEGLVVRVFQLGALVGLAATDATGAYRVDNVPLGDVLVEVTREANGDRGQASGTLAQAGAAAVVDVTLLGVGSVEIAVEDSLGVPVEGASVSLSFTRFGARTDLSGATSAAGSVVFDSVVAGSISVTAQALGLTSSGTFTATVDPDRFVLTLQALGGLDGIVRAPGGAPVGGASVTLYRDAGNVLVDSAVTAADGTFSVRDVPALQGAYRLDVTVNGQLRARERGVSIPANAVGSLEITLVPIGTVRGTLSAPVALSASTTVTLRSFAPEVGRIFQVSPVGDQYRIDDVPAGPFTITARDSANGLLGEASGTMPADGADVTVDVALLANTTTLPTSGLRLTDANGVNYRVQRSGASTEGAGNLFSGFAGSGGLFLDVTVGGVTTRYAGTSLGFLEESGREIVTASETLGDLDVQRKVYVPADGYFARYLEILDNPQASPVDVELALVSDLNRGSGAASVVDAAGGWVLLDDGDDRDPFEAFNNIPAVAFVTGALASVDPLEDGPGANQKRLTTRYAVTVPAGGRVVLLHFVLQQLSREAGRAAAERLVALPPEALVGLEADEAAAVVNFAVPANGSSLVPPLPPRNGRVSGALLGLTSEGATRPVGTASGIGNLSVELQSDHVLFRRIWKKSTATGAVSYASPELALARDGFHLRAYKTLGGTTTEAALDGDFTGRSLLSHAPDAAFEASSVFGAQVAERVLDGNAATDWRPATDDADPRLAWSLPAPVSVEEIVVTPFSTASLASLEIVLDGAPQTHAFETPAGELRVVLDPPVEASTIELGFTGSLVRVGEVAIRGTTAADIGSSWRDVVFTASGAVELTVETSSGAPAPSTVTAKVGTQFLTNLQAPEGALYLGPLAPEAAVSLTAVRSGVGHPFQQASVPSVALVAGEATPVLLTLPEGTTLSGRVTDSTGAGLGGQSMTIFGVSLPGTQAGFSTDANGFYGLTEIPSGDYSIRVIHAGVTLNVPVTVTAPTPAVKDIQFYAPGTVNVELRYASGDGSVILATGAAVTLVDALSGSRTLFTPSTGASAGRVSFTNLPPGAFTVSIPHPSNPSSVTTDGGTLPSGGTVTLTTVLPAFGTIVADVDFAGGAPANGAVVELSGAGVTHAPRSVISGIASFTNVPGLTPVTVLARHPAPGRSHITTQQSVTLLNQGESANVPLALPVTGDVVVSVTEEGTGAGVAGVDVFVKDAFSADFRAEGPTGANGERVVNIVPEGAFTVRVERNGALVGETSSAMAADGLPVSVAFTVPSDASIEGFVFAGDGLTPVAAARVELRSEDGAALLEQTTAASDGAYRFDAALAPGASALVRALYPADTTKRDEQAVTANASGDLIALDLVLPVAVVTGRVLQPGGVTPVEGATVELRAYGRLHATASASDAVGRFVFLGESPGLFELVAEDASGLAVFAAGELVAADEPLTLDLVLPEHGSVEVRVLDENAVPVSGAVMTLRSGALRGARATLADAEGVYRFDRVPYGAFGVLYDDSGARSGFAVGVVSAAAPIATLTVELPGFTAVYGNLTEGGLPVLPLDEFVPVWVESRLLETESGVVSQNGSADLGTGEYRVEGVPAGEVTVTVSDLGATGASTASVTGDLPEHRVDVERGSALDFPIPLGTAFDVDADGAAFASGTLANIVSVDAKAYPFLASATPDGSDPSHVVLGPVRGSGLLHARDLYAPAGQKFVRYLEVFENPHAVDVAITLDLEGDLVSVAPLAPGEGTLVDGALAHVFAGETAGALLPSFAGSENGYGSAVTWRELVVPAGGRVVLMHYLVAAADETEARAIADGLSSLTHPNALDALEPGLAADVINFEIP